MSVIEIPRPFRTGLALCAGIVIGAAAFAASPAATQALAPGAVAPQAGTEEAMSDVERFCSNIADAARDRRYAIQRAELETLQSDIDARIATLEEKRAEYEAWLQRRNDFLQRAEDNLVEIYSQMRPDAAALQLAESDIELAAGIIMKLEARKASVILNEMDSKTAASVTHIMASATRKQDPS